MSNICKAVSIFYNYNEFVVTKHGIFYGHIVCSWMPKLILKEDKVMKKFMACALSTCMVAATLVGCDNGNAGVDTPVDPEQPGVENPETPEVPENAPEGTFGDWAITDSPVGFFWGGTWVIANKNVTKDADKKAAVAKIMEWITLDTSETGLQYLWANGTFDVAESDLPSDQVITPANGGDKGTILLYTFTTEVPRMMLKYAQDNPDFGYKIQYKVTPTDGDQYVTDLNGALPTDSAPDMYTAESAFVYNYTQGDMAKYACPYDDLGIDSKKACADAQIAQYTIDIGSNPEGKLVGLGYQATGGALIYRRSIAKAVWDTDDPAVIKEKVGGGSGNWDQFYKACDELKAKGYAAVSGAGDLWNVVEKSSDSSWLTADGKLHIDPKREDYLDMVKKMYDNEWMNDTQAWQDPWFADMKGQGPKQVFCFFGPAWLVNYSMQDNCGNKPEDAAAAGDCVASAVVMDKSKAEPAFLGGQNMFEYFVPANAYANGKVLSKYDGTINNKFNDQVSEYKLGNKTKEEAIQAFKDAVNDELGVEAE